jgi:hypothetical protein
MFESLAERIKQDERGTVDNTRRPIFWVIVLAIAILVFAGIYFGMRMTT